MLGKVGANEKINNIFGGFPYWSTSRLGQFVNDSRQLPFDAHLQAALVAPVCTSKLPDSEYTDNPTGVKKKRALIWDEGQCPHISAIQCTDF